MWLHVAAEEALHFDLLRQHLRSLGRDYGDFDAHDGLWNMVKLTSQDVLARMALVPRTLEARGLDATPPMQDRLRRAGDLRAVEILAIILRDEVGHVAIGNHWYRWLCQRDGLDPVQTYDRLAREHHAPRLRGPFNVEARLAAGFTHGEVDALLRASTARAAEAPRHGPRAAGRARPFTWRDVRHTGSCGQGRVPCRARSSHGRTAQKPVALLQV